WRLKLNCWRRAGGWNPRLAAALAAVAGALAALLGIAGFALGWFELAQLGPQRLRAVWAAAAAGFALVWLIGLAREMDRADGVDPARLLHLPVLPGELFLMNFLSAHA